ncbi:hypothetical protein IE81DRAFT_165829 [Ceraceosorus guamensis]|uniref:INO80 complex subunit B-like conserved region domain-containing protein n=1 Tax=Ceraceosorus guamensis TaxID=1522189 RepID=A0A316W792_9BASI|nr:hypothetical protein IE81DRAFT_165829 [Ceraceosorus guamensis]PWN45682.1 hypothetical protein IE81DRAFT_165829 [Ceraceosorus guamensis]
MSATQAREQSRSASRNDRMSDEEGRSDGSSLSMPPEDEESVDGEGEEGDENDKDEVDEAMEVEDGEPDEEDDARENGRAAMISDDDEDSASSAPQRPRTIRREKRVVSTPADTPTPRTQSGRPARAAVRKPVIDSGDYGEDDDEEEEEQEEEEEEEEVLLEEEDEEDQDGEEDELEDDMAADSPVPSRQSKSKADASKQDVQQSGASKALRIRLKMSPSRPASTASSGAKPKTKSSSSSSGGSKLRFKAGKEADPKKRKRESGSESDFDTSIAGLGDGLPKTARQLARANAQKAAQAEAGAEGREGSWTPPPELGGEPAEELMSLPMEDENHPLRKRRTEAEEALRKSEINRRRKNQSERKLEDEKIETINRLLKRQVARNASSKDEEDPDDTGANAGSRSGLRTPAERKDEPTQMFRTVIGYTRTLVGVPLPAQSQQESPYQKRWNEVFPDLGVKRDHAQIQQATETNTLSTAA